MIRKFAAVAIIAATLPACATITRGTDQSFVIESDPPGATAELSTGVMCKTPCALKLKRRTAFTVDITRPGYEPVRATVTSGISGGGGAAMAGNVILGGIIGAVVDGTNGSMNELKPNPLHVNLVRLGTGPALLSGAPELGSSDGVVRKVRAKTPSGYCLDVPTDYVGTGSLNRPAISSELPKCTSLSAN